MAYTVIGSKVNQSRRLEDSASVGGILVSEPVHRALQGTVTIRLTGRITTKGIAEVFHP
jgi:class 3 adenylate cyclase